jgi:hypothetical protein
MSEKQGLRKPFVGQKGLRNNSEKQGLRKPFVGQKGLRNNSSSYLILEAFPAVTVPPFSLKLGRSFFSFTGSN